VVIGCVTRQSWPFKATNPSFISLPPEPLENGLRPSVFLPFFQVPAIDKQQILSAFGFIGPCIRYHTGGVDHTLCSRGGNRKLVVKRSNRPQFQLHRFFQYHPSVLLDQKRQHAFARAPSF